MSKRGQVLIDAIFECERFVKLAKTYKPNDSLMGDQIGRAAAKRASMDATRALARLRKAQSSEWDNVQ